jgi:DNA-binding XRE family transcriptional regulator
MSETADETSSVKTAAAPKRKRALPTSHRRWAPDSQVEREIFARNLRRARISAGYSQRELAKLTGIAQAHISDVENAMHNICIDTMVKLAQAVRVPLHQLFQP